MIGVAIPLSLGRLVATEGRAGAVRRVFRRTLLLYALGLFYYGGFATPITQFRLLGVLQRLALCYFFAGLLFIYLRPRALGGVAAALLVGYWALLTFVPVPGFGAGDVAAGLNARWTGLGELALALRRGGVRRAGPVPPRPVIFLRL